MKLFNNFIFLSLSLHALARPTEPRPIATGQASGITTRGINLCSPKCKAELDAWQSCIYLPYCRDSRQFNNLQTAYDNCCKIAGQTKPQPENKPNEVVDKMNSILEYLGLNPVGKPTAA